MATTETKEARKLKINILNQKYTSLSKLVDGRSLDSRVLLKSLEALLIASQEAETANVLHLMNENLSEDEKQLAIYEYGDVDIKVLQLRAEAEETLELMGIPNPVDSSNMNPYLSSATDSPVRLTTSFEVSVPTPVSPSVESGALPSPSLYSSSFSEAATSFMNRSIQTSVMTTESSSQTDDVAMEDENLDKEMKIIKSK